MRLSGRDRAERAAGSPGVECGGKGKTGTARRTELKYGRVFRRKSVLRGIYCLVDKAGKLHKAIR